MINQHSKRLAFWTVLLAVLATLITTVQSTAQAAPLRQANSNSCVIPPSGPWPACATGKTATNNNNCVIPESGPWPPCAMNGGATNGGNSGGECTIPASGPWPECARGGNDVPAPPPPPLQLCPQPNGQPGPWVPCGNGMPQPIVTPTPSAPNQPKLCPPPGGQGKWVLCDAGSSTSAKVESFTAKIQPLGNGDDLIEFSWQTTGASSVQLLVGVSDQWADHRVDLASSGSSTTVYKSDSLTKGQIGLKACRADQCDIKYVQASFSCSSVYFFKTDNFSPSSCSLGNDWELEAVVQQFEHGFMIWIEDWLIPYVGSGPAVLPFRYIQKSGTTSSGIFWPQSDTWKAGDPISDSSLTPPEFRRQPTHGIGKVWRETPQLRQQMGWALSAEKPYTATRVSEVGLGIVGPAVSYLSLPDENQVIKISCGRRTSASSCSWSIEDL